MPERPFSCAVPFQRAKEADEFPRIVRFRYQGVVSRNGVVLSGIADTCDSFNRHGFQSD